MAGSPPDIEGLSADDHKRLVLELLEEVAALRDENAALREEIARLKGLKGRPKIKPSGMDKATDPKPVSGRGKRRGGKLSRLRIDEDRIIEACVPAGSRFKGYEDYVVQDLILRPHVVRYRRQRWLTPDGRTVVAPLPAGIAGHFGPELRRFVLAQYHRGQMTIPRLVGLLRDIGLDISKRQVVRLLNGDKEAFLVEARDVLRAGPRVRPEHKPCRPRAGSRSMTPAPGTRRRTAFARRSATHASPGSQPPIPRAGATFFRCCGPDMGTTWSTGRRWTICASVTSRGR